MILMIRTTILDAKILNNSPLGNSLRRVPTHWGRKPLRLTPICMCSGLRDGARSLIRVKGLGFLGVLGFFRGIYIVIFSGWLFIIFFLKSIYHLISPPYVRNCKYFTFGLLKFLNTASMYTFPVGWPNILKMIWKTKSNFDK